MLDEDENYFKLHGEPLFSSHMIDLSEEAKDENIAITRKYLERAAPMKQWLEMVSTETYFVGQADISRKLVSPAVRRMALTTLQLTITLFTHSPKTSTMFTQHWRLFHLTSRLPLVSGTSMVFTSQEMSSCTPSF
jgi:hypothetical protein